MILSKNDSSVFHRVILLGLSGSGKSTLAARLAEKFNLIYLDLENGKDTICKLPQEYLQRINYIPIPDSAVFPVATQTLMELFKKGKANICDKHGKCGCVLCTKDGAPINTVDITELPTNTIVVIDGITQLSASILAYTTRDKPVDYKPERDDWGSLRKYSEFFASQFQAFPFNLVCTAQAIEVEMEDNKVKLVPAFGSKDMSSKIAKAFGDVIYMEVKNKQHMAYSKSTTSNLFLTKSRSDFDIEALKEPSLVPLFENLANTITVPASPAQNAVKSLATIKANLSNTTKP